MRKSVRRFSAVGAVLWAVMIILAFCAGCVSETDNPERSVMIEEAENYIENNRDSVNGRYRGSYHLSPQIGWMNDPNGFVYYKGRYHMFWQYHPYSATNGLMYWGHAVSDDLISWEYLPVALAPDKEYDADGCWSGSAIVAGERLYLIYTGHYQRNGVRRQTQCLAWTDDGVNFTKYKNNPVVGEKHLPEGADIADFRDPYVWEKDGTYYMLVGTLDSAKAKVLLYSSDDLYNWRYKNEFLSRSGAGYCWECPSLVDADGTELFLCSPVDYPHGEYEFWNYNSTVYATGKVDYAAGIMAASQFGEVDYGLDFYAAQAIKGRGGKTIMTAWMNMWGRRYVPAVLGDGWTGSLILPRELYCKGGKLYQKPVSAISDYYKNERKISDALDGEREYDGIKGRCARLDVYADVTRAQSFEIRLFADEKHATVLRYDVLSGLVTLDRSDNRYTVSADARDLSQGKRRVAKYRPENGVLHVELFLDNSSVEAFFGEGELTMTALSYNDVTADGIVFSSTGETQLKIVENDIEV